MNPFSVIAGAIGSIVSGFFKLKGNQADMIKEGIKVLSDTNASNAQREQAIATIIAAESSSTNWLASSWRPVTMYVFLILVVSFWFGYVPPNISGEMPPMLAEIFMLIKIGLCGYIPSRTIEKIVSQINVASIVKQYLNKGK